MNRPKLILLVGIPGSGKTTYANKYMQTINPLAIHLSSDLIRKELWGDESIQGDNNEVFSLMQSRAVEALNNGKDVIYDATNMTRKDRSYIISLCPKFVQIEAHIIWAPIETCIERDAARERTVGKAVIDKMLKRFEAPYYDEGINEIEIIRPEGFNCSPYIHNYFEAMKIPHDNPHHTLDIYDHCWAAFKYIDVNSELEVAVAAFLHDIAKPYTKEFIDRRGNLSETAHFYQHHCVGAWVSYGCADRPKQDDAVFVAWLISTHMDPFLNTKYYRNLPPYLKEKIDLLHEADRNAH